MRLLGIFMFMLGTSIAVAAPEGAMVRAAKSLLTVQQFPKTFEDLSFSGKMQVLSDGYEPWEAEYDESGRCISGCIYPGMTIAEEVRRAEQQTQQAVQQLQQAGHLPTPTTTVAQQVSTDWQPTVAYQPFAVPAIEMHSGSMSSGQPVQGQVGAIVGQMQGGRPTCSPNQPGIRAGQKVPVGEPVVGKPRVSSPFGERIHPVTGKRSMHRGVDLAVPSGTNVFSPASGSVVSAWTDSTCGNGLKIAHSDGYETVYCHLSKHLVHSGDDVKAGCLVAKSGNTGRSTGPHLHYAVKKNGEFINPAPLMGR